MKSYSAYFVHANAIANAEKVFDKQVKTLPDSPWLICAYRPDDEVPEDEIIYGEKSLTKVKSEQLGEIIFVFGDTSVDWFVYEHACDGKILRKLV